MFHLANCYYDIMSIRIEIFLHRNDRSFLVLTNTPRVRVSWHFYSLNSVNNKFIARCWHISPYMDIFPTPDRKYHMNVYIYHRNVKISSDSIIKHSVSEAIRKRCFCGFHDFLILVIFRKVQPFSSKSKPIDYLR